MTTEELNALRTRLHNWGTADWTRRMLSDPTAVLRISQECVNALDQFDRYEAESAQLRADLAIQAVNAKTVLDEQTKRQQAEHERDALVDELAVLRSMLIRARNSPIPHALRYDIDTLLGPLHPDVTTTLGDSNAKQASLAGHSANASNVESGNLADSGRSEVARDHQQPAVSHAERMFRSYPGASGVADLVKSRLFQTFLGQGFWHAHHVDLVWRYNGQDVREEADWLKDLWYAIRGAHPRNGNG